jgi:RNA polymerase sigma-70 factor (ECF subfamily)
MASETLSHIGFKTWRRLKPVGRLFPVAPLITDEQLAHQVQQGNAQTLTTLVERHHSALLGYLYRLTGGHRPLAEDLTQEAFLRALRRIAQYQYPRPFKPWLYAIATNLARDHYKQAEQRYTTATLELAETWPDHHTPQPGEVLVTQLEAQAVVRALATLPPPQRETIVLRYYQDLSLEDIATALHIPLGTVKSRLSLGLKRLKALLRDE